MKTQSTVPSPAPRPSEDQIREKAQELYLLNGCLPGRDLDNWLEAEATLSAAGRAAARTSRSKTSSPARKAEDE